MSRRLVALLFVIVVVGRDRLTAGGLGGWVGGGCCEVAVCDGVAAGSLYHTAPPFWSAPTPPFFSPTPPLPHRRHASLTLAAAPCSAESAANAGTSWRSSAASASAAAARSGRSTTSASSARTASAVLIFEIFF